MKQCPTCQRTYGDETLNFCFDDGSVLVAAAFEEPATAVMSSGGLRSSAGSVSSSLNSAVSAKSIAVLPFAHLSSDADDEFFCDGLAEELLNALAKIGGLKVAARTSSFTFKGSNANVSEIGRTLGVSTVLEGGVRKSGSRLRITVQLINAADGYHLWSERYDREMSDIFDVQDEITLAVIEALKLQLLGEQRVALTKRATDNAEAYELYLRGRAVWSNRRYADFDKASGYFKRAIEVDPNYALAYSGLADCYSFQAYFEAYPPIAMMPVAKAAVDKAMELDDSLAESHSSLAMYKCFFEFDGDGSQRELERAIEIDPKSLAARYWYCTVLSLRGRFDDSIREGHAALEVDPLSSLATTNLARAFLCAGRFDEGVELAKKNFELVPDFFISHWLLGWAYCETGETEKGIEHYKKSLVDSSFVLHRYLVKAFVRAGRIDEAQKLIDELDERSNRQFMSPLASAIFYAEVGDMATGLELLEEAWQLRTGHLMWMGVDPLFDIFRPEPRFQAIWQQMKI